MLAALADSIDLERFREISVEGSLGVARDEDDDREIGLEGGDDPPVFDEWLAAVVGGTGAVRREEAVAGDIAASVAELVLKGFVDACVPWL